jgi:hypothetical protein
MVVRFKRNEQPDLLDYPSAQAQDHVPLRGEANIKKTKRKSKRSWLVKTGVFVTFLAMLAAGALGLLLSQGPISNEQIRAGLENQLSQLLGDNLKAQIGDANVALGERGLISIKAADVKLTNNGNQNLGVVNDVSVQLKALPFLSGKVKAESIALNKASVSILPYINKDRSSDIWNTKVDLSSSLASLGAALRSAEASIESAGLDSITLNNTAIIGFEGLGLRSRTATASQLVVKHNANFQTGLQFTGLVETQHSNWLISGSWLREADASTLNIQISGLKFRDFLFAPDQSAPGKFDLDGNFVLKFKVPYSVEGKPQKALGQIALDQSNLVMGERYNSVVSRALLNFSVSPEDNEVTIENSPIVFPTLKATLSGVLNFQTDSPAFTLKAGGIESYAMLPNAAGTEAELVVEGKVDRDTTAITFDALDLKTKLGGLTGDGAVVFADGKSPRLKLNLSSKRMDVAEFKQIWPEFLAPKVRDWVRDGVRGGQIQSAEIRTDFPFSVVANRLPFSNEHIKATMDITGANVRTAGDLPRLLNARGKIKFQGVKTTVSINSAVGKLTGYPDLKITNGQFVIPDYTAKPLPADLSLDISSSASSMVVLSARKPLKVKPVKGLEPSNVSGTISSTVNANLLLHPKNRIQTKSWTLKSSVQNGSSRGKIAGRSFSSANVKVTASSASAVAEVSGRAKIDGVNADVALVQPLDGSAARNSVTMQLDDKARKKLGIETGDVIQGPIAVSVGSQKGGGGTVTVDLRNAKLSFPWIGWSKGKGVAATATFSMEEKKGATYLNNIRLKGSGFSAGGSIVSDKSGLRSANLTNIKLNKTDDLDVKLVRTKSGYDVSIDARSYDGRAIIKSALDAKRASAGKGLRVNVKGRVRRLLGFNGQILSGVSIDLTQRGSTVNRANLRAVAAGDAPTSFSLVPKNGVLETQIQTANAGSVLAFLDIYSKLSGGTLNATLNTDNAGLSRGKIQASNFKLLNEPRLAALLKAPSNNLSGREGREIQSYLKTVPTQNAQVDTLLAEIIKSPGNLRISRGRLSGGDASAAFEGTVYDSRNRMKITGTFLPGKGLNTLISKIPLIGLAFGNGKTSGLLGITFQLRGNYKNPQIRVNPLSIIAPGVFRKLFQF